VPSIEWMRLVRYDSSSMRKAQTSCRSDSLSDVQRSALMALIRSKNTLPERLVAALLCSMRYRFASHDATLPGTPDFVLTRHKLAIFVHGCFWHAHSCRRGRSMPVTRRDFWEGKKKANVVRDRRAKASLRRLGFRVLTIWECQLRDENSIRASIRAGIATSRR